jgi:hypothetical protein
MTVLITYDIKTPYIGESKNKAVKDAMKDLDYYDNFTINNEADNYYLPNTSLLKNDTTPSQAKTDLLSVAKACGATVERLFATEVSVTAQIQGEPF